jgi:hypothetical protein
LDNVCGGGQIDERHHSARKLDEQLSKQQKVTEARAAQMGLPVAGEMLSPWPMVLHKRWTSN